jgi:hypothetical protein
LHESAGRYEAAGGIAGGRLLWPFRFPEADGAHAPANGVALSPDGKTMAVAGQGGPGAGRD